MVCKNGKCDTDDEAAVEALQKSNPESIKEDKEHGIRLYQNRDGTFSATDARVGEAHEVSVPGVPAGKTNAGDAHTHGDESGPTYDDENFNESDKKSNIAEGKPGYLATPSELIKKFDPFKNDDPNTQLDERVSVIGTTKRQEERK